MEQQGSKVFLTAREVDFHYPLRFPDQFKYNPKANWPMLQRLVFWFARKLKTEAWEDRVKYRTIVVDTKDITEAICRNAAQAELIWQQRAKYVVMGPRAFSQLTEQGHSAGQFLRFPIRLQMGKGQIFRPLDLEIIVVPWIEGFFVMPELKDGLSK